MRDLPWRHSRDAYKIWLSEVILQQTRVDQGMAYYHRFVETFPDIKILAEASEQEVLKLWQGLGYYSRARNLHFAAKQIMTDYDGIFPETYDEIIKLKGVGEYTAAAISSIAFGEPHAVVDGNVKRVAARIFGIESSGSKLHDEVKQIMTTMLDHDRAGDFNQAVMEFGALQCTPKHPACGVCVFNETCFAFRNNMLDVLPAREKKKKPIKRYFSYFVIQPDEDSIILNRRNEKDIWKNLYEFPLIESGTEIDAGLLMQEPEFEAWFGNGVKISGGNKVFKHQLSHQTIFARYFIIDNVDLGIFPEGWKIISSNELENYPISRLIERYLEE